MTRFAYQQDLVKGRVSAIDTRTGKPVHERLAKTLAKRGDPVTSHLAAERAANFTGQRAVILMALQKLALAGAEEIGRVIKLPPHKVRKRLSDLKNDGFAEMTTAKRLCDDGRSREAIWRPCEPTEAGPPVS